MNNVGNMPSSLDKDELMRKLTSYLPVLSSGNKEKGNVVEYIPFSNFVFWVQ